MTYDQQHLKKDASRWLHGWAVLTVCVTLPLLLLGAEVTTKKVGMVDAQGFRFPWHLFTVPSLWERGIGYIIEHSHRLAGFIVGTCIIVLAVSLWRREPRRWVRWLGVTALAGVIVQGLLGGFRVQLDAWLGPNLALIHGCFAQLVFALLVSLAVITSRGWQASVVATAVPEAGLALRRWSLVTACLVYLQIVFGAVVRHTENPLGPRVHLLFAFVVVGAVVWLIHLTVEARPRDRQVAAAVTMLAGLVILQLLLGVETWLARFEAAPQWSQLRPLLMHPEFIRTLHYVAGSLIFASAVVVALQAHRRTGWAIRPAPAPLNGLEGAA